MVGLKRLLTILPFAIMADCSRYTTSKAMKLSLICIGGFLKFQVKSGRLAFFIHLAQHLGIARKLEQATFIAMDEYGVCSIHYLPVIPFRMIENSLKNVKGERFRAYDIS